VSRAYPRVHSRSQIKPEGSGGPCGATGCAVPARWSVRVSFDWFRGEDGFVRCCEKHCQIKSISPASEVKQFCKQFPSEAWK